MGSYAISLAVVSGICFATGLFHLFIGLRRQGSDMKHFTFGLFAVAYGGAVLTGMLMYRAATIPQYLAADRWSGVFAGVTYIFLIWFVAIYTEVRPLSILAGLTLLFAILIAAHVTRQTLIHGEILGIAFATLPWGEQIAFLEAAESTWEIAFFLAQLLTIGFLFYACIRQYRRGERAEAQALGAGLFLFAAALVVDMLVESSVISFVLTSDFGLLPLAIVMSLRISNDVIQTEEELAYYRQSLEALVAERTAELETANAQLAGEMAERLGAEQALRRSESAARALINAPPDSAFLLDAQGIILDLNEIAAVRLNLKLEQARGRYAFDLFEPQIGEARRAKFDETVATKRPVHWQDRRATFVFDNTLYPILDDQGEVIRVAAFAADITERVQFEEALRRRVEELAALNTIARAVTQVTELADTLAQASEIVTDLFAARYTHVIWSEDRRGDSFVWVGHERGSGHTGPGPLDLALSELPGVSQVLREARPQIMPEVQSLALTDVVHDFLVERNIQSILLAPLAIRRAAVGVLTIASDQPEQVFGADEVRLAEIIATDLAAAIEGAHQVQRAQAVAVSEERSRLARELHDSVTQILFSINLIALSLGRLWKRNPDMAARSTDELQRLTRGALAEMRTLLRELRPQTIAATELSILLKQLSDGLSARHDIPVNLDLGQICELPPEVHVALYRIAQEALSNITKHAEASQVTVKLARGDAAVQLTITDDGQGFDPDDVPARHMGLDIMRERADAMGAAITITSQPGAGTSIVVAWPILETGGDTHAEG